MDHSKVGTDLLSHRSGDFGLPRAVGRVRAITPVCLDALGETWAGYVAEGPEKGRMVLVTLASASADSPDGQRILAGLNTATGVRHPNVLALLEVERDEGIFALVSEYLDGEPLSTLLSTADAQAIPIPQGVALAVVKETIDALISLRQKRAEAFPFGGLCPDVIFVAAFGETMLRNPGIEAQAMDVARYRLHPSSLPYRAPEQLSSSSPLTESADVFSAGVILWETLAGRPLFGGQSHLRLGRLKALPPDQIQQIQKRVLEMPVPSLATIQRHGGALHPAVIELLGRALARAPSERPSSLAALSELIDELPQGLLASSVEIAATVEKLAGKVIQKRQRILQDGAPVTVYGSKPPSSRVSSAPEGGDRATVEIPMGRDLGHLGELLESRDAPPPPSGFSAPRAGRLDSSRATSPLRPRVEDLFDAKTKTPDHARKLPAMASTSSGEPPAGAPLVFEELAPESSDGHSSKTPPGHLITVLQNKAPRRRGGLWLTAAIVLLVGGGVYITMFSQWRGFRAATARATTVAEDPADAHSEESSPPAPLDAQVVPGESAVKGEAPANSRAPDAPVESTLPDGPRAEDGKPLTAPAVKRPVRPRPLPSKKASEESSGAFRPMGI